MINEQFDNFYLGLAYSGSPAMINNEMMFNSKTYLSKKYPLKNYVVTGCEYCSAVESQEKIRFVLLFRCT